MQRSLAMYGIAVLALWLVGGTGAILYAKQQHIPLQIWMAVLPPLLLEAAMYIATGFPVVVQRLSRLRNWLTPALAASALAPYAIASLALGTFQMEHVGTLLALAAAVTLWYRFAPRHVVFDLLFLALMAGVYLSGIFPAIYHNPAGKPPLDILGRMMWIRLGIFSVLLVRKIEGVSFGFLPTGRDWLIGGVHFLLAIPFVLPLALWINFVHPKVVVFGPRVLLTAVGTFLGMLWVVALAEEFFFRGLLQQWMQRVTGSFPLGVGIASLVFGLAHLPMRGFPNYKFALLATVAGVFYGLSYARAKSIRASMVTHALVNTAWRVFLG